MASRKRTTRIFAPVAKRLPRYRPFMCHVLAGDRRTVSTVVIEELRMPFSDYKAPLCMVSVVAPAARYESIQFLARKALLVRLKVLLDYALPRIGKQLC